MAYVQRFPSLSPLPLISDHTRLPQDAKLIDSQVLHQPLRDKLLSFVTRGSSHLSILSSTTYELPDATLKYSCVQHDFPIEVLIWFPKALEEFRRPPAQGGLHAGAMISNYVDVCGEMLTVGRTTEGYALTNWSRSKHGNKSFAPIELALDSYFLFEQGFLQRWQSLGERYK
ncbi:hypothetical protein [Rheinheimera baltica]|uniref:hypothetical protein n=1 Tax=Rheinheimera baltica TaxID=67576 RepID=UPI0004872FB0|nr:hypothetical protein [Rheinheimera baltica]